MKRSRRTFTSEFKANVTPVPIKVVPTKKEQAKQIHPT